MRLYEINEQLERLLDIGDGRMVDEETGELFDQEALEALEMEREEKIDGCLFFIKNCNLSAGCKDLDSEYLVAVTVILAENVSFSIKIRRIKRSS